jgi:uncharacterized membrane protein YfcA
MPLLHNLLLLFVGFLAGTANSIAGGGQFLIYPLLLSLGVPPVSANATGSMVVWPGQVSSAFGYRKSLSRLPRRFFLLLLPCIAGGITGAILLGQTSNHNFKYIVPWFILLAAFLLYMQPSLTRWLAQKGQRRWNARHRNLLFVLIFISLLIVSIYGGYFGAGFGIMMLAFLGLSGLNNLQQMNGMKNLTGIVINGIAIIYFIHKGLINWHIIPLIVIGTIAGGLLGSTYSQKMPAKFVHNLMVFIALAVAAYLFYKAYI